jgi:hypothetical protein
MQASRADDTFSGINVTSSARGNARIRNSRLDYRAKSQRYLPILCETHFVTRQDFAIEGPFSDLCVKVNIIILNFMPLIAHKIGLKLFFV